MSILSDENRTLVCNIVRVYPLSLESTPLMHDLFFKNKNVLKIIFNINIIYQLLDHKITISTKKRS